MKKLSTTNSIILIAAFTAYYIFIQLSTAHETIITNSLAMIIIGSIFYLGVDIIQLRKHPFNIMIKPLLSQWEQNLPWYIRWGLYPKTYILCLNLSESQLEHTLVPNLKPAFNFKHKSCQLHGFHQDNGAILIEISHPKKDIIALHHLWKELRKAGIYFKICHLLLSARQIINFDHYIQKEWPLLIPIMRKSHNNHLILYEEDLHHDLYYACEYNACAIPWFSYDILAPFNVSRHHVGQNYDHLMQTLLLQINDLCMISPIESGLRKKIFLLPKRLSLLKFACINALEKCKQLQLGIKGLGLTLFHTEPPAMHRSRWNIYQRLQQSAAVLLLILSWQIFTYHNSVTSMQQRLMKYSDNQVMQHILKLDPSTQKKLSSHILRSQTAALSHLEDEERYALEWMIAQHPSSALPESIQTTIAHKTKISAEQPQLQQTLMLWAGTMPVPLSPPDLKLLAHLFPNQDLIGACRSYPKRDVCEKKLTTYIKQQQHISALDQIYHTLLPIDTSDLDQAIRQISYLNANPNEIVKNVDHSLQELLPKLHQSMRRSAYEKKVTNVRSVTELLRSPQGKMLLKILEKFYVTVQRVQSPQEAIAILHAIPNIKDHPFSQIQDIKQHLSPEQTEWLDSYTEDCIKQVVNLANIHLHQKWEIIQQKLSEISRKYPFTKSADDCHEDAFIELFSQSGLIQKMFADLSPFIQTTPEGIALNNNRYRPAISSDMLRTIMYAQVMQASTEMNNSGMKISLAIRPKAVEFPVKRIDLIIGKERLTLSPEKLTTVHWKPMTNIALECILSDGTSHMLSKANMWGLLQLLDELGQKKGKYQIRAQDNSWHINLEIKSLNPVSITTPNLFSLPQHSSG